MAASSNPGHRRRHRRFAQPVDREDQGQRHHQPADQAGEGPRTAMRTDLSRTMRRTRSSVIPMRRRRPSSRRRSRMDSDGCWRTARPCAGAARRPGPALGGARRRRQRPHGPPHRSSRRGQQHGDAAGRLLGASRRRAGREADKPRGSSVVQDDVGQPEVAVTDARPVQVGDQAPHRTQNVVGQLLRRDDVQRPPWDAGEGQRQPLGIHLGDDQKRGRAHAATASQAATIASCSSDCLREAATISSPSPRNRQARLMRNSRSLLRCSRHRTVTTARARRRCGRRTAGTRERRLRPGGRRRLLCRPCMSPRRRARVQRPDRPAERQQHLRPGPDAAPDGDQC